MKNQKQKKLSHIRSSQSQVKLELLALLKQIFEHKSNYCFSFGFQLNPLYFTVYFREDKKSQTVGL